MDKQHYRITGAQSDQALVSLHPCLAGTLWTRIHVVDQHFLSALY